ncbi:murein hydrolase activator EnvC family protein [Celeribacter neptunius]|uniref:Septal ring factor EnvC, activator of murein hydrolases AmiA and AmiB n=1 Tax=Celeribacter neptunius TaxID=588602 RepID=A0A1I3WS93_9RHOB|nr:peptidoglycan DD-metalloendopeptidase family protein [Celeribacter neptunius]SFK10210.1 Septal ring factor EnvC, activator of murein hydrolases AmiA and AmiB [Celeribacter neptunius]
MRSRISALCAAVLFTGLFAALSGPVLAQEASPAALAEDALAQFNAAHARLEQAESAPDRVKALTGVVQAYENGLEAMRAGLRQVSLREAELSRQFADESGRFSQLLGVLIGMKPDASPEALVHPNGPLGQARAGMLVSAVTPGLQAEVENMRVRLEEVQILRELQSDALDTLSKGLQDVQQARTDLSQAMSDRTDLPHRFTTDAERMQVLIDSSESLESFATGLAVMDVVDGITPLPNLAASRGTWPMPAPGRLLRSYNEADAAGVKRPGWLWATRPLSLVTTPWPATLRYKGPFLDYGNVIILEPGNDVLLVLAGLDEVYGDVGAVLPAGTAVGLMGGAAPDLDAFVKNATQGTGAALSETLYIEVREGGQPVNPERWFADAPL